jgi:hypothetical protein
MDAEKFSEYFDDAPVFYGRSLTTLDGFLGTQSRLESSWSALPC